MHRVAILIAVVVLLAGVAAVTRDNEATAQDAMATHPVVGAWRIVKDFGEGPSISYAIFHADGSYIHLSYVDGPMTFGAWEPSGSRTADLRYHHLYLWDDRVVEAEARAAVAVDETGKNLEGPNVYVSRYVDDGTLEYSFETTLAGTRIDPAPLVPLETLLAATPAAE